MTIKVSDLAKTNTSLESDTNPTLSNDLDVNGNSIVNTSGPVNIDGLNYPSADGAAGFALITDGSGNLTLQAVSTTLGDLTDVDLTGAATNEALTWNGANWVPEEVLANQTTTDLPEGANLYYTDARVNEQIALSSFTNVIRVDQVPVGANEFATVAEAIAEVNLRGDASATNLYAIEVGPGTYSEAPFTLPSHVTLIGHGEGTTLNTTDNTQSFITLAVNSYINDITLGGPTDPNTYTLDIINTISGAMVLTNIIFNSAWGFVDATHTTNATIGLLLNNTSVASSAIVVQPIKVETTSNGPLDVLLNGYTHSIRHPLVSIGHYFNISGALSTVTVNELNIVKVAGMAHHIIHMEDGASVLMSSINISNANVALHVDNVGSAPFIRIIDLVSTSATYDILVDHPGTVGSINGTINTDKISVADGSPVVINVLSPTGNKVGLVQVGDIFQGTTVGKVINVSNLIRTSSTLGITNGGDITVTDVNEVTISAGHGFVERNLDGFIYEVDWVETVYQLVDGDEIWITVDYNSVVSRSTSPPGNLYNVILLGRVYANNGVIEFIEDISLSNRHNDNKQAYFFRDALGPVYSSGSIVSESSTALQLNISGGRYYYSADAILPSGGTDVEFVVAYRDGFGGTIDSTSSQVVPVMYDNDSGILVSPPASDYVKHALYVVGDGSNEHYYLVVGQETNDNISVAEQANLPLPPEYVKESFALIASIIVREGDANIISIFDERPVIGFKAGGVSASTTHGNLLGLTADDHPQYLRTDGTRELTGDMNLDGNAIANVLTINDVTIEAHADRHLPNGADPIATATPATVGSINTEGVQNSFARSDHIHSHGNQLGGLLHANATGATAGFMSAADKTLLDNIDTDNVSEAANLYYTDTRARASLSGGTGVDYDDVTGEIAIGQSVGTTDDVLFNSVTTDVNGSLTGNVVGNIDGQVSDISNHDTDDLSEGSVNLYYTDARARASLSGSTGVDYDDVTGEISIGQSVETTDNVTFNTVTADLTGQVSDISNHDTGDLTEGSNLYHTTARARASLSGSTGVDYDDVTGEIAIGQSVGTTDNVTFNNVTADLTGQVSDISNHDTGDLTEGSNLYHTTARARAALSGGTGVGYNSLTGAISIGQAVGTTDNVTFNNVTADLTGQVSDISNHDTDDLAEGSANLYYTQSRARSVLSGGTGVDYNSGTGTISIGQSVETTDNVTFNTVTADLTGQVSDISNHNTDSLDEGTVNLYFTEERARDSLSNGTGVEYNETTGEISIGQSVETTDNVTFNTVTADLTGQVSDISNHDTDDITEGITNLYYTNTRARASLSAGTGVTYNSLTGAISIGQSVSTSANVIFNTVTANLTGNVTGQVSDISNHSTTDLSEGSNLYYTTARARSVLNGGTGVDYNSATGEISIGQSVETTDNVTFNTVTADLVGQASDISNHDTGDLTEGSNLYHTTARARASLSAGTGVTYDNVTGEIAIGQSVGTTDDVTFNSIIADVTGNLIGNVTGQVSDISNHSTTDLVEGTNLYYTDARVDARVATLGFKNLIIVDLDPINANEFDSIADALAEIANRGDLSATNTYVIQVGAGTFVSDPFTLPQYVTMLGFGESTLIVTNDNTQHFITMEANSYINDITLTGPTDANTYTINFDDSYSGTMSLTTIVFKSAWGFINAVNTTNNTIGAVITTTIIDNLADVVQPVNISTTSTGKLSALFITYGHILVNPAATVGNYFNITGTNTLALFSQTRIECVNGTIDNVLEISDGANIQLSALNLIGADTSIHSANVGAAPFIKCVSSVSDAINYGLLIDHPGTTGSATGTFRYDKMSIADGSPFIVSAVSPLGDKVGLLQVGDIYQGDKVDRLINLTDLIRSSASLGVESGGAITIGPDPDEITVAEGHGFIEDSVSKVLYEVNWDESVFSLVDDEEAWILVDYLGNVTKSSSAPANLYTFMLLGRVYANNGSIEFVEDIAVTNVHNSNNQTVFFRDAMGPIYATGSLVTESSTALQLNISNGRYYYSARSYLPSGGTDKEFTVAYRDGSGDTIDDPGEQVVPVMYDNDSGTLQTPPASDYVKHALYVVGDGASERYYLVVGQETNNNISVAEQANLPLPPSYVKESFALIASIIVREGDANIISIFDERPVIGFKAGGVSASTAHGNLLGLDQDDHPQYLRTDGSRLLSGDLDLNGYNIANAGTVNSITIETHAARHLPNGADPLTTGPAVSLGLTNSPGVQNSFSRSDHIHSHGNLAGGTLHATATDSTDGFMSAADKTMLDNLDTDDVAEATNLYYTDTRSRAALSSGTGVSYNSGTGTISIGQDVGISDDVTFNTVTADITGMVSDISNHSTTDLSEGTNLYFTDTRARDVLSGGTGVDYDDVTGEIAIGQSVGPTDDVTFNSVTTDVNGTLTGNVIGNINGNVTGQVSDISNHNTTDLSEGTNLYYTDTRARASLSGGTGVDYNSATGEIAIGQDVGTTDNVTFSSVTADLVGQVTDISNHDTDFLSEGAINLYYTTSRARSALNEGTGVSYNSGTGLISIGQSVGTTDNVTFNNVTATLSGTVSDISNHDTDDLAEGNTNLYHTTARARSVLNGGTGVSYNSGTGTISIGQSVGTNDNVTFNSVTADITGQVSDISNHDTDDLAEGSNLYFTQTRARSALSGGTGVNYNSSTGAISIGQDVDTNDNVTFNSVTADVVGQVSDISNHTTTELTEGANLYFTDTRARDALSSGTGVTYDDVTGEIAIGQSVGTADDVVFDTVTADVIGTVSSLANQSTSNLSEGSNLYHTTARARNSVSAGTGVGYNSLTGIISIGQSVGTTSNVTFNTVTADVNGTVSSIANHTTDDLPEGSVNMYHSDANTRAALSGGTGVTYDDVTGEISVGQDVGVGANVTFGVVTGSLLGNMTGTLTGSVLGNVTGQVSDISNHTTTGLAEGTNLYYTDARVDARIGASGDKFFVNGAEKVGNTGTALFTASTSGSLYIFNILSGGQPIFANLNECTIDITVMRDTTDNTQSPWVHLRAISGNGIAVQIKRSNAGNIPLFGGGYSGNENNNNQVTLRITVTGVLA